MRSHAERGNENFLVLRPTSIGGVGVAGVDPDRSNLTHTIGRAPSKLNAVGSLRSTTGTRHSKTHAPPGALVPISCVGAIVYTSHATWRGRSRALSGDGKLTVLSGRGPSPVAQRNTSSTRWPVKDHENWLARAIPARRC